MIGYKLIFVMLFMCITTSSFAAAGKGEVLEKELWEDIKAKKWATIQNKMATNYQSVYEGGTRDRNQELSFLKTLKLADYQLSNMKVSEGKGILIVTYTVSTGSQDKKQPAEGSSTRMSVWQNSGGTWQWVAHANLEPLETAKVHSPAQVPQGLNSPMR